MRLDVGVRCQSRKSGQRDTIDRFDDLCRLRTRRTGTIDAVAGRIVAKVDELMALCDRLETNLDQSDATRRRLLDALLAEALAPSEDVMPAEARVTAHG